MFILAKFGIRLGLLVRCAAVVGSYSFPFPEPAPEIGPHQIR